ncbi:hypothetical protein acsn021_05230 [Anaerocolumna cellulosilytica]|uniref:Uncharacterized protein n=1 Tax=Anaerocolumna cellulosilytica TaxID=433286 RepID=A0A6S6QQT4_9FIRM|nr:glycosyltransferase [Anaerocolumna cellulosilytica]MBB5195710.1 hypothetical protein [Anaerocolumna cellulosilytica]BCJ92954.1 hypothetical protein acsn021_05230 [Anaerocolumna cellulosilytica]
MVLKNCNMKEFHEKLGNKQLICFGIGNDIGQMILNYPEYSWAEKITFLVDNDCNKHGKLIEIQGKRFEIKTIKELINTDKTQMVIIITCSYYYEIVKQLNSLEGFEAVECYIYNFMLNLMPEYDMPMENEKEFLIPPVIHYCWFGKGALPDFYKKCIASWKKYCPTYEIVEWNESNCDLTENLYALQAYQNKKYGFVPDYFRLKIIYENGGIYLDTDVEVIKNLDLLRYNKCFCGMQLPGEVNLGLGFGACKGNQIINKLLETYSGLIFQEKTGNLNEIASPVYQTNDLFSMGMEYGNKIQKIGNMVIYPTDVLSPKNLYTNMINVTKNTHTIHHFDGSWASGDRLIRKKKRIQESQELQKLFI